MSLAFGEYPRRKMRDGHSIVTLGSIIRCSCGWRVVRITGLEDMAEEQAWLHVSQPDLLILGSSDVEHSARLARLDKLEQYREG